MKLSVQSKRFLNAVQMANSASAARSTIPSLTSLLLETKDGKLVVYGSDNETSVAYSIDDVEITRPGSCLIPAGRLLTVARENNEQSLTINSDEKRTSVQFGRSKYDFNIQHVDTYPKPAEANAEGKFWYEVSSGQFSEAVRRSCFAISPNAGSKWATQGAQFIQQKDASKLGIVCTDTKQLVYYSMDVAAVPQEPISAIVPAKALDIATKNCEADDIIRVSLEKQTASFACGGWTLTTAIIAGVFPPYMSIIPKNSPSNIEVDVAELTATIRRGAIMLDTVSKRIDLVFADNALTVKTPGIDEGNSLSSMPIQWEEDELSLGFDADHLTKYLRTVQHAKTVKIGFGKNRPMTMKVEGADSTYLIMPMY